MNKLLGFALVASFGLGSFPFTTNDAEAFYRRGYGGYHYRGGYYGGGGAIAAGIIGGFALGALAAPAYGYNRRYYGGGDAYYGGNCCYPRAIYYNAPTYYSGYYGQSYFRRAYYSRPIVRPYTYYGGPAYYRPIGYFGRPGAHYYGRRW